MKVSDLLPMKVSQFTLRLLGMDECLPPAVIFYLLGALLIQTKLIQGREELSA